jgi:hypothetical protein
MGIGNKLTLYIHVLLIFILRLSKHDRFIFMFFLCLHFQRRYFGVWRTDSNP